MSKYLFLALSVVAGFIIYEAFPVRHGPGVVAEQAPSIKHVSWQKPIPFKGATLIPQKVISGKVRVIRHKRYFFDRLSKYTPTDVLVGWNELSDERNLDRIYPKLGNRSFEIDFVRLPLKMTTIYQKTDLWHLIPSTTAIDKRIKKLRNGHIIKFKGLLVNIEHNPDFDYATGQTISNQKASEGYAIWLEEFQIL